MTAIRLRPFSRRPTNADLARETTATRRIVLALFAHQRRMETRIIMKLSEAVDALVSDDAEVDATLDSMNATLAALRDQVASQINDPGQDTAQLEAVLADQDTQIQRLANLAAQRRDKLASLADASQPADNGTPAEPPADTSPADQTPADQPPADAAPATTAVDNTTGDNTTTTADGSQSETPQP